MLIRSGYMVLEGHSCYACVRLCFSTDHTSLLHGPVLVASFYPASVTASLAPIAEDQLYQWTISVQQSDSVGARHLNAQILPLAR